MIQAVIRNKIKSEIRDYFKTKEDTLTSSVFGNMLFLPTKYFLEILSKASYDRFSYSYFGDLQNYDFWPHWNSKNTSNEKYVEPDLFLRFENVDMIIEAKRYDDFQQNKEQWKKEVTSYYNEYKDDKKELIFLAVGGININNSEKILVNDKEIKVIKVRWKKILYELIKIQKDIEMIKPYSENINSIQRIINVIIQGFELHGFLTIKWFKDFNVHFYISDNTINNWKPNNNYLFHFNNNFKIEKDNINIWKQ